MSPHGRRWLHPTSGQRSHTVGRIPLNTIIAILVIVVLVLLILRLA